MVSDSGRATTIDPERAAGGPAYSGRFDAECPPRMPVRGLSLVGLVKEFMASTRTLLRQEVHLARAETAEKVAEAGRHAGKIGIGGVIAHAGVLALVGAACAGLWAGMITNEVDPLLAVWLAPLIVGIVVAAIGYAVLHSGLAGLRGMRMAPEKTAESLKETGRWMREKVQ